MTKLTIIENPEIAAIVLSETNDVILAMQESDLAKGRFAPDEPKQGLKWFITDDFGEKEDRFALKVKLEGFECLSAYIKRDGCCEIYREWNEGLKTQHTEQMHICDVSRFVTMLQSLEEFRVNNVGTY